MLSISLKRPPKVFLSYINSPLIWNAATMLADQNIIEPVYVPVRADFMDQFSARFPHCIAHDLIAATKGIPPSECADFLHAPFDDVCMAVYARYSAELFEVARRFSVTGRYRLHDLQHTVCRALAYWNSVIHNYNIDMAIFWDVPHGIYDLCVFYLCKEKNIATLVVSSGVQKVFPGRFFLNDYRDVVNLSEEGIASLAENCSEQKAISIVERMYANYRKESTFQTEFFTHIGAATYSVSSCLRGIARYGKILFRVGLQDMKARLGISEGEIDPVWLMHKEGERPLEKSYVDSMWPRFSWHFAQLRAYLRSQRLLRIQSRLETPPDMSGPFVYYPLATQPEASTVPLGGLCSFQLLGIKMTASALPEGWRLLVKEHPHQYSFSHPHPDYRADWYYEEIASMPNVQLVDAHVDGYALMDKARAVVSFSAGSSATEAIVRGRPAIVGGYGWIRGAPGVLKVESYDELKKALALVKQGFAVDAEQVRSFLIKAARYSAYAAAPLGQGENTTPEHAASVSIVRSLRKKLGFDVDENLPFQ